jgi:hypothetical protein
MPRELVKGTETDLETGEIQEEFTMLCRQDFTAELGGSPQAPQAQNPTDEAQSGSSNSATSNNSGGPAWLLYLLPELILVVDSKGTSRYSRQWGRRRPRGPAVSFPAPADIQTLFTELGPDVNHHLTMEAGLLQLLVEMDNGQWMMGLYRRREPDSEQGLSESKGEWNQGASIMRSSTLYTQSCTQKEHYLFIFWQIFTIHTQF